MSASRTHQAVALDLRRGMSTDVRLDGDWTMIVAGTATYGATLFQRRQQATCGDPRHSQYAQHQRA